MKKLQQMKYVLALMLSAACFVSCERDSDANKITLTDIYADFEIKESLDVNRTSIDFEQGENTHFTAEFSKPVIWELSITGNKSGAEKTITGFSKELNAETAIWDGSTTIFPMFKSGEDCSVELNVPAEDTTLVLSESITVKKAKENTGFLIDDFEGKTADVTEDWGSFIQSGASMKFNTVRHMKKAAQGQYFYTMQGEVIWDWLIGMIHIPDTNKITNISNDINTNKEYKPFGLSEKADNLYFNVLVNVRKPNGILLFNFKEDDNMDGIFNKDNEDEYTIWLQGLEPGWQQVSIKYSSLTAGGENPTQPKGNRTHNPERLKIIDVLLLADPETGFSRVDMDYMIFTENEPLKP